MGGLGSTCLPCTSSCHQCESLEFDCCVVGGTDPWLSEARPMPIGDASMLEQERISKWLGKPVSGPFVGIFARRDVEQPNGDFIADTAEGRPIKFKKRRKGAGANSRPCLRYIE
eukprot:CAMPEP_0194528854 /NCGR_PEP_ID=MMETSP0253-20130528/65362_1 /TAXON_ID=2966 /ORGANISM="Noctiluca scintillans" /LENGTH=113 /DNA_ID=CAMNT_0039373943 /DNA_START=28 /DNA_END=369 /DNA_ORIENTATION=-